MWCRFAFLTFWLCSLPLAGAAQPSAPDVTGLLAIATRPFLARTEVETRLAESLPDLDLLPLTTPDLASPDPYYWAISGHFGPPLSGVQAPGGVVACARYGRMTLDALAPRRSAGPEAFPVWQQAVIQSDDARAWPEQAVARVACSITWDDGRRVAALGRTEAEATLSTVFEEVSSAPDPRERPGQTRVFGPGGYLLAGQGPVEDSTYRLDLFEVDQLATHHQILFRSYLLGGGV